MEFEKKTSKCPECGDKAVLSTWKPPRGLDQRFRQYICTDLHCRFVFYTNGIFHIEEKRP